MIAAERVALVLLAAGASRRFGAADKLMQDLCGMPLGLHVARALAAVPFAARIAVVDDGGPDYAAQGFQSLRNPRAYEGMGRSVALGVGRAAGLDVDAILVVLADMPCVSAALVARLLAAAEGDVAVIAASAGTRAMPPALFGRDHFAMLSVLQGDSGARDLIPGGCHIVADPDELIDIDTPEDLARLIRGAAHRSD